MVDPNYNSEEELKSNIEKGKTWTKKLENAPDFKVTKCPEYDHIKDYHQDDGCFVIIKIENGEIVVSVCNYDMQILEECRGKTAQQIYNHILNKKKYFTRLDHAAYLGKELKKAEQAIKTNSEYVQE